jgi:hypothetical protein
MSRRMKVFAAAALIVGVVGTDVSAYQLNPLKDRERGGVPAEFGNDIGTVHEDITHAAISCANRFGNRRSEDIGVWIVWCTDAVRERTADDPGNLTNPIIVGVWWNDNPEMQLFDYERGSLLHVLGALNMHNDAEENARRFRESGGTFRSNSMQRIHYRSHFGDLQFLHSMANRDGERATVTQQNIIDWMSFAYMVALGEIQPDAKLRELNHPISRLFRTGGQREWTVERLFKPRRSMRSLPLADIALGSMLHVAQDSFAAGHARRAASQAVRCPRGRVLQFHSYLNQNSLSHKTEDTREALEFDMRSRDRWRSRFSARQNPVEASTWLILFVRRRASWANVVEPFLRSTMFCVDENAPNAGPGEFNTLGSRDRINIDNVPMGF